uniref:Mucin 5B, oligomeric mucus/gel-forming n=1 Tax=Mandrillus leucophaeus TaxID=9568 RepID=A0A2K5ZUE8_MANLE
TGAPTSSPRVLPLGGLLITAKQRQPRVNQQPTMGFSAPKTRAPQPRGGYPVGALNPAHNGRVCSTWGDFHYKTFDGDVFRFPGLCNYVFSEHCGAAYEDFNVQLRRGLVGSRPVVTRVVIKAQGLVLEASNGSVLVNGQREELPYSRTGLLVEQSGDYVKVSIRLVLTFLWNGEDSALLLLPYSQLELDPKYANQTCGLCGDFNGLPAFNEFYAHNARLTPLQFGNLQKLDGPTEQCPDPLPLLASNCTDEEGICHHTLLGPAFAECHALVDSAPYLAACAQDLCRCPTCPCATFVEYSRQCAHAGGQPQNWRHPELCPRTCPVNMQHRECGSPCVDTCSNPQRAQLCEDHCVDGCFCPPGTVLDDVTHSGCLPLGQCPCTHGGRTYSPGASVNTTCSSCTCSGGLWQCQDLPCPGTCSVQGGAHITTYDEKLYDLHGDCSYVLSKKCTDGSFTVLAELRKCGLTDNENCLKAVTLSLDGGDTAIRVQADGSVFLNSIYTQLPLSAANITLFTPSSFFIVVHTGLGLQLLVQLVPLMQVFVRLDPAHQGQMCGLCGNFNQNQADDFAALSGVVEATGAAFANTWKAQAACANARNSFEDPCSLSVENENYARHWCSRLTDPTGSFSRCHSVINPKPFHSNCLFDTCNCERSEDCLCAALSSYVHACAAKGVQLSGWRDGVCTKYMQHCPKSQRYAYVVDACQPTCRGLSEADVTCSVSFVPVDGCTCPTGTFLNDAGACVPARECPCYVHGTVLAPGEVVHDEGAVCSCEGGKLSCLGASLQKSTGCVAPMVYLNCSNSSAGTPGAECLRSCHTLDVGCFSTHCVSGCVCPPGLVHPVHSPRLLHSKDHPHLHNATYKPGDTIRVDCNTCTCRNRRWECSHRLCLGTCVAYGDGHFITFDGERYSFEGSCEYILAQDYCGDDATHGTFRIVTENIPCGTTGTTCSKAIKLFVESYELILQEGAFKAVARGPGGDPPYKIRYMGIFLVIETRGMAVSWDRKTSVFIRLHQDYKGRVCGLCGNFDDHAINDFATRSRSVVGDALEFGNSWKLSPSCPDALAPKDPCTANPFRKSWAQKQCSILHGPTFAACRSQVDSTKYYEACVNDACACDSGGDCECFCTAVAAYAQACHDAGLCVSWRTPDTCPLFCDFYNPHGGCEWHYQPCGAPCLKTCRNPSGHCLVDLPGLEGCYPKCPPSQPFFNEDQMKCVAQCGCYDRDGNYYDVGARVPTAENCQSCNCTPSGIQCAHSLEACTCTYEDRIYGYQDVIYNTTDGLGACLIAICGSNGTIIRKAVACPGTPATTPFTFTTSWVPHSTTSPALPVSTVCVREVCRWSSWYNGHHPEPGLGGGDFETFENLRQRGYQVCPVPADIECRAGQLPDMPLGELGQQVDCDRVRGLMCANSQQSPPLCHDYELRVLCCEYVPCGPSLAPGTSPQPSLSASTEPAVPTPTQTTATEKTTLWVIPSIQSTAALTSQTGSSSGPTTVTSLAPGTTTCQPRCQWTEWFDEDYPKSEQLGGDVESYDKIRAAGGHLCEQPKDIECQAESFPNWPLAQVGQKVHCDVRFGLVCRNWEQEGIFKMCYNYRIRVLCCSADHCGGRATTPPPATSLETATTTTTSTQVLFSTLQSTSSLGVTSTTAVPTLSKGLTSPRYTGTLGTATTGGPTVPAGSTEPTVPGVATSSIPTHSVLPGTTGSSGTWRPSQPPTPAPTTMATSRAHLTGTTSSSSKQPLTTSLAPTLSSELFTSQAETSTPRTETTLSRLTETTTSQSTTRCQPKCETTHTSTTLTTTATTTQATGSTATLFTSGTAHTSKVLTTMAITTSSTATPSSSPGTASTLTALTTTTTPTTSGYTVTPSSIPGTTHTPTVLTNTTITVATGSMATPSSSPQTTGTPPALATTGTTVTATGSTTTPSSTPGTTPISPVLTTMATTPTATSTTVAPSSALGTTYTPPVLSTTATTHGRSQLPESPRTVPTARTSMATSGTTHITESSTVTSHTPVGTTGTTPHSSPALSSPHTHSRTTESPSSPGKTTLGLTTATTSETHTSTLLPSSPTSAPMTPVVSTGCEPQCAWSDWLDYSYPMSGPSGGDLETYSNIRAAGGAVCEQPLGLECRAQAQPGVPLRELGQLVECSLDFGLVCRNRQQVGKFKMCFNYEIRVFCCNYGRCPSTPATSSTATPSSTPGSTWILTEPTTTAVTTAATGSTTIPSSTPGTTWILTEPTTTAITTVVTGSTAIPSSTPGTTQITEVFPTTTTMTAATGSTANPSSTPGTTWILTEPTTTATITVATGSKATPSSTPASTWILTEPTTTAITTVATGSMATPSSTQGTTGSLTEPTNTATITVTTSSTAMPSSTPRMTSILTEPTTTAITTPTTTATITVATGSTAIPSSTPGMTSILTEPTTTAITTVATGSTATPSSTPETTGILTEATTTATITVATSSTAMPSSTPGTTLILTEPTTIAITTVAPGSTATWPAPSRPGRHLGSPVSHRGRASPGTRVLWGQDWRMLSQDPSPTPLAGPALPVSTVCVREVCRWSSWYNGHHPEPGLGGGDFETFENLRQRGYQVCPVPADIECRAGQLPDMPLGELGQQVDCDRVRGLMCANSQQSPPLCHDYELRVLCCEYVPCGPSLAPGTSPQPSLSASTEPAVPTPTQTTATEKTTLWVIPSIQSTAALTSQTGSSSGPTTVTSLAPGTTTCQPRCQWTEWFDEDYPKSEQLGGDVESYDKIRAAGGHLCEQPKDIECQAESFPNWPLAQVGQKVHCDVRFGLVCRNWEQEGIFKMCYNYRIRVLCCSADHCGGRATTPPPATSLETATTTTTSTQVLFSTLQSTSSLGVTSTTAVPTLSKGLTSPRYTGTLGTATTGGPTVPAGSTEPTVPGVATSSIPTRSVLPGTTGSSGTWRPSQPPTPAPTTMATSRAHLTGTTSSSSKQPLTTSLAPTLSSELFTSQAETSTPRTETTLSRLTETTTSQSTTRCQPKCEWTEWFDVDFPTSGVAGGDMETFENIRAAGGKMCWAPKSIECRAENYPEVSIDQIGQVLTCSLETGLICKNEDQTGRFNMCFNYNVRVLCCDDYSHCPHTAAPTPTSSTQAPRLTSMGATSPTVTASTAIATWSTKSPAVTGSSTLATTQIGPSFSKTTERVSLPSPSAPPPSTASLLPTRGQQTSQAPSMPTSPIVTSTPTTSPVVTTRVHTTLRTSSSGPTIRTTLPSGPPSPSTGCVPRCTWTDWFDEDHPSSDPDGGDFETFGVIRSAGHTFCEHPWDIECRSEKEPNQPLEALGQVVQCDVSIGLVCRNRDQSGPLWYCHNFHVRLLCCDDSHCATTPTSTGSTATTPTMATSSMATPSSTLGTTGILTEPTTTAITTVATGSTAIPSSTLGTTGIHTEPTTTATISVATSSTATPSSPPASTWFLTELTTTAITTMASGSTATLTSTPGTTYPPKVLTITATTPTATSSKATPSSTPGTTWILTEPTTLATPTEATGSTATIPTAPSSSATPFSSPGTAGTLPVQTTTATTTMATRSTAIPSSTVGTAGTPKVLTTMATRPTATGSTVPSSSTLGTTHTPAVRPSSLPAFSVSTVSSSVLTTLRPTHFPSSHFSTPCFCRAFGQFFSPGEVIYNRTDRAGCQFYAVCNQHCDLDRFQGTCPTSPPPASSTLLPSPSPAPGCDNAIPPRQVNETWILENCTVARCVGDNRVALLDPKPVANVTCVNKHLPIKVSDPSQPCDFHYECECICSVWGSSHYSTFDGTSYTFEGNCTYVLMREIHARLGNLSLYLDNHYCVASAAAASCSRALSIHYKSMDIVLTVTTVHGKEEDLILFDQIPVSSGFSKNGVLVSVTGTTTMRVDIPALGVSVTFDGHIFQARLPYSLFHNNTEGQCGTCTNNQRDDCLQRDGTTATSCKDMAKTWLVPDSRKDGCWAPTGTPPTASPPAPVSSAPTPSPCPPQPLCDLMLSQVFAECHDLVPPGPFFNACISDGCQGRPEVPCQSLEAYAALCRARGVCSDWRGATGGLCDLTCPPTKVYKPCGPIQPASCNSRNQNPQLEGLAEGCFCPGDQILFSAHTGTCVQDCTCVGPDGFPKSPGQQWNSNCQSCVCDEGSMSVQCKPLPCEAQGPPPPCSHPGFVTVTRPRANDPCCPETVCVCNTSTCHQSPPVCPPGQELISTQKEGDCCPTLLCSERGWGGTGVGAIFPGALPCHMCTCLSGDTQDPTVQCREDTCHNTTCPQGFEYKSVAGQCCGECVQTACLTPDGPPVQLNETWVNSRVDNCTVYHCEVESGVYLLTPQPASCPEVSSCRGSLRKTGCCYSCEEDFCQVRVNTTVLWHRGCKTEVNITFCEGSCPGESRYSAEAQAMQHQCTCCQERRVHEETVPLRCPDGSTVLHTYNHVDECGCTPFCVPAPMAPIYPPGFLAQEATAV